jgi:hypothetical protein
MKNKGKWCYCVVLCSCLQIAKDDKAPPVDPAYSYRPTSNHHNLIQFTQSQ